MAQTTDAITFEDCTVEISTNGSSWTNISGWANSVSLSGGERQTGETYTFDGEFAIVRRGKAQPFDVQINVVYTEPGGDPFDTIESAFSNGTDLYCRWAPKGYVSTNNLFTTGVGIVTANPFPTGESGNGEPVVFQLNLKCGTITKSVIA